MDRRNQRYLNSARLYFLHAVIVKIIQAIKPTKPQPELKKTGPAEILNKRKILGPFSFPWGNQTQSSATRIQRGHLHIFWNFLTVLQKRDQGTKLVAVNPRLEHDTQRKTNGNSLYHSHLKNPQAQKWFQAKEGKPNQVKYLYMQ